MTKKDWIDENILKSLTKRILLSFILSVSLISTSDIDKCAIEHICVNGRCYNAPGNFRCECFTGFKKDEQGANCTDIDECEEVANCINGECVNSVGSYECKCPDGFSPNPSGVGCVDTRTGDCFLMVEREETAPICSHAIGVDVVRATCCCSYYAQAWGNPCEICPERNSSEYKTLCPGGNGFKPNPITVFLEDIDECMDLPGLCQGGKCINAFGVFICECPERYALNEESRICENIDKCAIEHICVNGRCHNAPGNFRCECFTGFKKEEQGANCTDIDECEEIASCINGECVNSVGSYECKCSDGFSPNPSGVGCVDTRTGDCFLMVEGEETAPICSHAIGVDVFRATCCCSYYAKAWGNPCEICPERNSSEYKTLCPGGNGFKPNPITVFLEDIDECMDLPGLCQGGKCINAFGVFICQCPERYALNEESRICENIDKCAIEHICVNGRCHNAPGNFRCECLTGFEKDEQGANCTDIDECKEVANCINGECVNSVGSYECKCPDGFSPNPSGVGCVDTRTGDCFLMVEEEETAPICSHAIGVDVVRATCCCSYYAQAWGNPCEICPERNSSEYKTLCPGGDGFKPNPITVFLEDIDECMDLPGLCQGGKCINAFGVFICECPEGYALNEESRICENIDKCAIEHICVNGRCHNAPGNFRCECLTGFKKDEQVANCTDIDECEEVENCINGECVNSVGSYECKCPDGFSPNPSGVGCVDTRTGDCFLMVEGEETVPICSHVIGVDVVRATCCCSHYAQAWGNPCEICPERNSSEYKTLCPGGNGFKPNPITVFLEDIDECMDLPGLCQEGKCINAFGVFICECPEGYALNEESRICENIDKCAIEHICVNGRCHNAPGNFRCECFTGFKKDEQGANCTDIDECEEVASCINGECVNSVGSYECKCPDGFSPNPIGVGCVDVNECLLKPCGFGTCQNSIGSFICSCDNGYTLSDNGDCVDIDECIEKSVCRSGDCVNLPGTFECLCDDGYKVSPDGRYCVDANECMENRTICSIGTCQNMEGSYKCFCPRGYSSPDDKSCVDIDECAMPNGCAGGSRCRNTFGGYKCECQTGYQITNTMRCVDVDECATKEHSCQFICINTIGSYRCGCPHGFVRHMNKSCVDKDECTLDPDICGKNAVCVNVVGGYHCVCAPGFKKTPKGDGCMRLPCSSQPGVCGNQMCMNMMGGIRCVPGCDPSHRLRFAPLGCFRPDDCRVQACKLGSRCAQDENGKYKCSCNRGFSMMRGGCMRLPCSSQPGVCGNQMCMNMMGGIRCVPGCNPSHRLRFAPLGCFSLDDCRVKPCRMGSRCAPDENGKFKCSCDRGFSMMRGGCSDINECRFQRTPCNFGCQNNYGGYKCGCPNRFFGLGGGHCMQGGMGGFQQQMFPYGQMPPSFMPRGGGGGIRGRCYDCGIGRRQKRSIADNMEEVSGDDENRPPVNINVPVIVHLKLSTLSRRQVLIRIMPALRPLKGHTNYKIIFGNKNKIFRMHKDEDNIHFVHLNPQTVAAGKYKIKIAARPTVDEFTAKRASMNSVEIEEAMEKEVKFEVEFDIEK